MAESFLELRDVVVRPGATTVLNIRRLAIAKGEILSLLGPNGAGKTTLLKVIALLQTPDAGEIMFSGSAVEAATALATRRRMAMVFQEPLLLNATVYQNASLGLKLRGHSDREIKKRLDFWLDRLGIAHLAGRRARTLSGGEAQRTSLTRALVLAPELLLLDEPFSSLDPSSRDTLLQDFQKIVRELGITTIFVTHERHEAYSLGDRIGVLKSGELLHIGPRDEVFSRPASEAVAEIVGIENRLSGNVAAVEGKDTVVDVNGARIRCVGNFRVESRVVVCLRSDAIAVGTMNCVAPDNNHFRGEILDVSLGMTQHRIAVGCRAFRLIMLIERSKWLTLGLSKGDDATVVFKANTVHLIDCGSAKIPEL
ncbi:MAG: ABC transporter ATP-binding protein [Candidatus Binatia bacterium]